MKIVLEQFAETTWVAQVVKTDDHFNWIEATKLRREMSNWVKENCEGAYANGWKFIFDSEKHAVLFMLRWA